MTARATAGREATASQQVLADSALAVFRLNGQFLGLAEQLARPAGLTAAWWQVLGAVLGEPLSVSDVARAMGLTRQSVQRIADLLVERGLAAYEENPAHRRAKLLRPTDAGRDAVRGIGPRHRAAADALVAELGEQRAGEVRDALLELAAAMDRVQAAREAAGRAPRASSRAG